MFVIRGVFLKNTFFDSFGRCVQNCIKNLIKKNKRAALELSFNVVFAAIVGVVVLVIAASFIANSTDNLEQTKNIELRNSVYQLFSLTSKEDNFNSYYSLPSLTQFDFMCEDVFIDEDGFSIQEIPVFSAKQINTTDFGFSSKSFEYPFKILIFVTIINVWGL